MPDPPDLDLADLKPGGSTLRGTRPAAPGQPVAGIRNRKVIVSASQLGPTAFTPARYRSPCSILRTSLLRRLMAAVSALLTG
jgi:hypothetical protein